MVIVHTVRSLRDTFEARASEWALTGAVLSLGIVFMFNGAMFERATFQGMRDIIDHRFVWAAIFFLVGITRLTVLLINGAYWRTPHYRALTAFLSSGIWFSLCLGFAQNGSILIALSPWIFLLDAYNVKRASREAGNSEFLQRHMIKKKQDRSNAGNTQGSHS